MSQFASLCGVVLVLLCLPLQRTAALSQATHTTSLTLTQPRSEPPLATPTPTLAADGPLPTMAATTAEPSAPSSGDATMVPGEEPTPSTTVPTNPAPTTAGAESVVVVRRVRIIRGATVSAPDFGDPELYDAESATVEVELLNDTWAAEPRFTARAEVLGFEDPLGFAVTPNVLPTLHVFGSLLNMTFNPDKCFTPKMDDRITFYFTNDSTASGAAVQPFEVAVLSKVDRTTLSSGIILTAMSMVGILFIFLLDDWCEALITLLQLQCLVVVASTNCAPASVARIFASSSWVLWPLSENSGSSTAPIVHGRMIINFVFVLGSIFLQFVALTLFGCFSKDRDFEKAKVTVRYPAASVVVATGLLQGSMFASWNVFSLWYLGFLGGDVGGTLALAACTLAFLVLQLSLAFVTVFRVVSKQVFKDSTEVTLWQRIINGGSWTNPEMLARWGVLYSSLHGSSFWFIVTEIFLVSIAAAISGFVPGSRESCSKQYFAVLAAYSAIMIIMFLRRPFKSMLLNFMNILINSLIALVMAAFTTAMTCSRKGEVFAATTAWFLLVLVFFKTIVVVITIGIRIVLRARALPEVGISSRPRRVSPARQLRDGGDADELSAVFLLEERKEEDLVFNVAYKPSLPLPVIVGPAVVSREAGFGARGGLSGSEGPSVSLQLQQPYGISCDMENLYIVDSAGHRILRHHLKRRRLSTLAGGHGKGYAGDGESSGDGVKLNGPRACALGQQCLFVADTDNDCVRRVDFASGHIHTVVGGAKARDTIKLSRPFGVAVLGSALFIADTLHHRVVMYDLEDGMCRVVVGTGHPGFDQDGTPAAAARLSNPQGLCVDKKNGSLYIADTGNHRVACLDPFTRRLYTVVGVPGVAGEKDTDREPLHPCVVTLCLPTDVACLGDGSLLVVDGGNAKIWLVSPLPSQGSCDSPHGSLSRDRSPGMVARRDAGVERTALVVVPPNPHFIPRCIAPSSIAANYTPHGHGAQRQQRPLLHLYVSDSVNHIVCHVDGTSRASVFAPEAVAEMRNQSPKIEHASRGGTVGGGGGGDDDGDAEAARGRSDIRDPTVVRGLVSLSGPGNSALEMNNDGWGQQDSPFRGEPSRASRSGRSMVASPPPRLNPISRFGTGDVEGVLNAPRLAECRVAGPEDLDRPAPAPAPATAAVSALNEPPSSVPSSSPSRPPPRHREHEGAITRAVRERMNRQDHYSTVQGALQDNLWGSRSANPLAFGDSQPSQLEAHGGGGRAGGLPLSHRAVPVNTPAAASHTSTLDDYLTDL